MISIKELVDLQSTLSLSLMVCKVAGDLKSEESLVSLHFCWTGEGDEEEGRGETGGRQETKSIQRTLVIRSREGRGLSKGIWGQSGERGHASMPHC